MVGKPKHALSLVAPEGASADTGKIDAPAPLQTTTWTDEAIDAWSSCIDLIRDVPEGELLAKERAIVDAVEIISSLMVERFELRAALAELRDRHETGAAS